MPPLARSMPLCVDWAMRHAVALLCAFIACTPTFHGRVEEVFQQKCVTCHRDGGIAPFSLTNYQSASAQKDAIVAAINIGEMPPWPPSADCNSYAGERTLSAAEKRDILAWAKGGAPEGMPAKVTTHDETGGLSRVDLTLTMAEPYTAQVEPDEYRCFIIDWPETETRFLTGFTVRPGDARVVHHVIAYAIPAALSADLQALDDSDPGPGYTCFGGPRVGVTSGKTRAKWLGAWAPGSVNGDFPAGTGLRVDPGTKVVLQVHYNSLNAGVQPDQTSIDMMIESSVTTEAFFLPFADPSWLKPGGMPIAAGDPDATHSFTLDTALISALSSTFKSGKVLLHSAGLHMHTLGTHARLSLKKQCVLDIPRWDFHWQGTYRLQKPIEITSDDAITLECHWDNTAAHQPVYQGVQQDPRDVQWGEGTTDEMCLALLYLTPE
jgi:hypothetical protein